MTREEREKAIAVLNTYDMSEDNDDTEFKFAVAKSIEALDQEPTLDKIRAEIKGMYRVVLKDTPEDDWAVKWNECVDEVLQIIDKCKAESEE